MVLVDDAPRPAQLAGDTLQFRSFQRRHAAATRDALLVRERRRLSRPSLLHEPYEFRGFDAMAEDFCVPDADDRHVAGVAAPKLRIVIDVDFFDAHIQTRCAYRRFGLVAKWTIAAGVECDVDRCHESGA